MVISAADVSVVIPTLGRPDALVATLGSILDQSEPPGEIVVVVDGPDPDTVRALESVDRPVAVVRLDENRGPAAARNAGVAAARHDLVAFADDDDPWLRTKLERQVGAVARESVGADFVCSHPMIRRTPDGGTAVVPRVPPSPGEPIADYLFTRRRRRRTKGALLTPSLLLPRALLLSEPFDESLRDHEDWDLLVRLGARGVPLVFVDEPLAEWSVRSSSRPYTQGVARSSWHDDLLWADRRRELLGDRAYAGFLLNVAIDRARADRSWRGYRVLVSRALAAGASAVDIAMIVPSLLPERVRDRLAHGRRGPTPSG